MALGNACSDSFDVASSETRLRLRGSGVMPQLLPLLEGTDSTIQLYATALLLNMCKDMELALGTPQPPAHGPGCDTLLLGGMRADCSHNLLRAMSWQLLCSWARRSSSTTSARSAAPRNRYGGRHLSCSYAWQPFILHTTPLSPAPQAFCIGGPTKHQHGGRVRRVGFLNAPPVFSACKRLPCPECTTAQ